MRPINSEINTLPIHIADILSNIWCLSERGLKNINRDKWLKIMPHPGKDEANKNNYNSSLKRRELQSIFSHKKGETKHE